MTSLTGIGTGGYNPYSTRQSLFNEIDTNGDGSITKAEVEKAVTTAGGTTQAADALYAQLDPNNTGSVTEQQFDQNLPSPPFSDQIGAQMMSYQAQGWPGSSTSDPASQLAQNLFSQIDTNGDGSITKSELETAVTSAGGTTQAADALYAQLDPNNTGSVTEQQFAQALSQAGSHHHHHGAADRNSAQDALASLFEANGATSTAPTSPAQVAQNLFSQIDTNGDGSITKSELETAVTSAGGTTQAADALYSQLDPNNTGSVTEQQFAQALQPPSPTGTTAQDAILALLDPTTQNASPTSTAGSSSTNSASGTISISGNTAQDALMALMNNISNSNSDSTSANGNSAQDALMALLNASLSAGTGQLGSSFTDPLLSLANGSSSSSSSVSSTGTTAQDALFALLQGNLGGASATTASSSSTGTQSGVSLASALALYQSQINQQMLATMTGSGGSAL